MGWEQIVLLFLKNVSLLLIGWMVVAKYKVHALRVAISEVETAFLMFLANKVKFGAMTSLIASVLKGLSGMETNV